MGMEDGVLHGIGSCVVGAWSLGRVVQVRAGRLVDERAAQRIRGAASAAQRLIRSRSSILNIDPRARPFTRLTGPKRQN